ncbi:MAG TPA: HAMP domain-containing sensor histidine kinase [Chloroflexota bacterium]|nr:HAMP domain-containing sensor histidine kinase [Chloroflexota bacterium]
MFGSLRAKLIASYVFIVILTLFLAGTGFTYVLRAYQTQLRLNQLADLTLPLALQVRSLQRPGVAQSDVAAYLKAQATYLNVRILLVQSDRTVVLDTGDSLVGQKIPVPSGESDRGTGLMQWGLLSDKSGDQLVYASALLRRDRGQGFGDVPVPSSADAVGLIVAVPQARVTSAWLAMAPNLMVAALLALVVAILVAMAFARSIARPLAQVTRASERMAKGDFDQFLPIRGDDEVGQLASSFNTMAREVGRTHQTMRDFLANVSHELRTPLTSIEGFSTAMQDGTIQSLDEYQDAARIIGDEAVRMHRLVEDLLYLSKFESGQIDIVLSRLNLTSLINGCVRQVQPQLEAAGVKVAVETVDLPPVLADEHRLEQVFVNLLDNAVKYSPANGEIRVRAYPVAESLNGSVETRPAAGGAAQWVAVDVHNSGSYIPAEHANRIFERFYQIDRSRTGHRGSSGLGLAIVREIVQAHHGKIGVTSNPDQGTTFTVTLPAA